MQRHVAVSVLFLCAQLIVRCPGQYFGGGSAMAGGTGAIGMASASALGMERVGGGEYGFGPGPSYVNGFGGYGQQFGYGPGFFYDDGTSPRFGSGTMGPGCASGFGPALGYGGEVGFDYGGGVRSELGYGGETSSAGALGSFGVGSPRYPPAVSPLVYPSVNAGPALSPTRQQAILNANENTNTNTNININNVMGKHRASRLGRGFVGFPQF